MWPGAWGFIAFLTMASVSTIGTLGWGVGYFLLDRLFERKQVDDSLSAVHLIVYEIGVVLTPILMGYVGWVGGAFVRETGNAIVVTQLIDWTIIPTGMGIAAALLGALVGVINFILAIRGIGLGPES